MSITPVSNSDLDAIERLISSAIRHSVVDSDDDARFLETDIGTVLQAWGIDSSDSLHLKYEASSQIVGVILVKKYWNLANLFVLPNSQRRGIGRTLIDAVLPDCRSKSPKSALLVNSSTVGAPFYTAYGFRQTGPAKDRPGGCIPMAFRFD